MPWLRAAVAEAGHDSTAASEIRGTASHLNIGGLLLHDVAFRFGHVLVPDAVVLHGTEATFTGTTVGPVTFTGWNAPPLKQPDPPAPVRHVKTILRDEHGQVVGIEEVTG